MRCNNRRRASHGRHRGRMAIHRFGCDLHHVGLPHDLGDEDIWRTLASRYGREDGESDGRVIVSRTPLACKPFFSDHPAYTMQNAFRVLRCQDHAPLAYRGSGLATSSSWSKRLGAAMALLLIWHSSSISYLPWASRRLSSRVTRYADTRLSARLLAVSRSSEAESMHSKRSPGSLYTTATSP